ncbi:THUMP domain-containing protein 1 [Gracilariopsis chorda]|uniref:THUMP domain-containing protein 1 n=1 Tax=Gracilariopsis chorda TaxID=448386 RepID=A0A2V3IT25_9FLOR|nr:THUMP domain-containing protein 1 [Gracilariopsis chorda]|eukprot:PXF44887.1 THUMP domain-containing protein 1 [Gracilariopsis chorda]
MTTTLPQKRASPLNAHLPARARRKKFRASSYATVRRSDLTGAQSGVLVSCTPGHEQHAFRDAVLLFSPYVKQSSHKPAEPCPTSSQSTAPSSAVLVMTELAEQKDVKTSSAPAEKPDESKQAPASSNTNNATLEEELAELRDASSKVFTRVIADVKGTVFLRVNDKSVDLEHIVESALIEARESGSAGSRHCVRVIPVFGTCYARAEVAAATAVKVVKQRFPHISPGVDVSYAIVYRSRLNNSVKRDDFIKLIADAIYKYEPRYKVNLTKPDVVLIVEVLKGSCCIGVFRKYYQLAKLNLREVACPSKPKEERKGVNEGSKRATIEGNANTSDDKPEKAAPNEQHENPELRKRSEDDKVVDVGEEQSKPEKAEQSEKNESTELDKRAEEDKVVYVGGEESKPATDEAEQLQTTAMPAETKANEDEKKADNDCAGEQQQRC